MSPAGDDESFSRISIVRAADCATNGWWVLPMRQDDTPTERRALLMATSRAEIGPKR